MEIQNTRPLMGVSYLNMAPYFGTVVRSVFFVLITSCISGPSVPIARRLTRNDISLVHELRGDDVARAPLSPTVQTETDNGDFPRSFKRDRMQPW